jgi:hypothetical protein
VTRFLSPLGWLVIGLAAAAILMVGGMLWLQKHDRDKAAPIQAGRIIAEGQAAAGRDAVGVVVGNAEGQAATDKITEGNRDAILSAPGAQAQVDHAVGDAGRRSVCLRRSARDLPACKRLLDAHP